MVAICGKVSFEKSITKSEIEDTLNFMLFRGGLFRSRHLTENFAIGIGKKNPSAIGGLFYNEDHQICIGCDGEIYNIEQIIKEQRLHVENSLCALPGLYEKFGESFLSKLEGNFSLVVWDGKQEIVILARDHIGSKPLFYTIVRGNLIFASEINGLLKLNNINKELDLQSLDFFLNYSYIEPPHTLFKGIYQVKPGNFCTFSRTGRLKEYSYFNGRRLQNTENDLSFYTHNLRALLEKSIKTRINGKNNIGFLLSGGTDTASLVGLASSLGNQKLKTFTLGFPEIPEIDEAEDARKLATHFNTNHIELEAKNTCIEKASEITRHLGSPAGNPANLISFSLFKEVGNYVDTVMCGDGGNEIFGGTYKYHQVMNYITSFNNKRVSNFIKNIGQTLWKGVEDTKYEALFQKIAKLYFKRIAKDIIQEKNIDLEKIKFQLVAKYYARQVSTWGSLSKELLYTNDVQEKLQNYNALKSIAEQFNHSSELSFLQQLIFVRTNTIVPGQYMPYVEYNAISNGVSPLFPFLDKELLEFMYIVPFKYTFGKGFRYLMQQTLANKIVPDEVFSRTYKGFKPPIEIWLKTPLWKEFIYDHLSFDSIKKRGLFSPDYINNILKQYYSGKKFISTEYPCKVQSLADSIWTLVAFEVWCREFL